MKRGDIWTASGGPDYAGKPRPCLIVQSDRFALDHSVTICGFTTSPAEASILRPSIVPSDENGLRVPCRIMIDKITTVPRARLGQKIGVLSSEDLDRAGQAMLLFLGFGG